MAVAHFLYLTFIDPDCNIAEFLDVKHRMATKRHCLILLTKFVHPLHALFLKGEVADRKCFVDNQYVWTHHGRNREREPNIHSRGVGFNRPIDKVAEFGKFDNAPL